MRPTGPEPAGRRRGHVCSKLWAVEEDNRRLLCRRLDGCRQQLQERLSRDRLASTTGGSESVWPDNGLEHPGSIAIALSPLPPRGYRRHLQIRMRRWRPAFRHRRSMWFVRLGMRTACPSPPQRARPDGSIAMLQERDNSAAGEHRIFSEFTVLPTHQPIKRADPKGSVASRQEGSSRSVRSGAQGEDAEASVVRRRSELHRTRYPARGNRQASGDCVDCPIREAVAKGPGQMRVLSDIQRWVKRTHRRRPEQQGGAKRNDGRCRSGAWLRGAHVERVCAWGARDGMSIISTAFGLRP